MPQSVFAAVGQDGLRTTSEDGYKWLPAQIGKEGEVYRAVCFGNGTGVAVGNYGGGNIFAQTSDGKTWKTQFVDAKYVYFIRGLSFGNGKFLPRWAAIRVASAVPGLSFFSPTRV